MADLTLALTGAQTTSALGTPVAPGIVSLTLPRPAFATSTAGAVPDVIVSLPVPQLQVSGKQGQLGSVLLTLPVPVAAIVAQVPLFANVGPLYAPAPQLSAAGLTGVSGGVVLALPLPVVQAHAPNSAALTLPMPQLAASALTGLVGDVAMSLPVPGVTSGGKTPYVANVVLTMPAPSISIAASLGNVGASSMYLRSLALAAAGATGTVGTVTLKLPLYSFSASGYGPLIGVVQLTMPSLQLKAVASVARGTPSTVVMHTETNAVWTYSNFPFNSFARFNGVYLGAADGGIFALSGDTDNGVAIQAAARVGISDFSTSYLKRVDRIYVGYSATGDLILRIFTDGGKQRDYRLQQTPDGGLHGNHARLGKGLESRYWQFEVRNQNGSDFSMNMIELKPTRLKRRVGGRDA